MEEQWTGNPKAAGSNCCEDNFSQCLFLPAVVFEGSDVTVLLTLKAL